MQNKGYSLEAIKQIQEKAKKAGKNFVPNNVVEPTSESVCFYFVGEYKGNAVVFDACIFTLRLEYEMQVYQEAEGIVADIYPGFNLEEEMENNDDSEAMELFDETAINIIEQEEITVSEHMEYDTLIEYGIGLDICLNVEEITDEVITKFIQDFNNKTFELDTKEYFFNIESMED